MIRVLVDGVECPLVDNSVKLPRFDVSTLTDIDGCRLGQRIELEVIATSEVERLFEHASVIYRYPNFNDSYHVGQIEVDGVVLFEGVTMLISVSRNSGERVYRIAIRRGGAEWAERASTTRLKSSSIEAVRSMTLSDIEASWNDDSAVRMLPLFYDKYPEQAPSSLYHPQQTLMPHNYHPFISVRAVVESIARDSGYKLVSKFFDSELGRRLVFSGAYRSVDVAAAAKSMGFKAMRTTSNTATAGSDGRVYVWEPVGLSNVGALVDTVSPNAIDQEGNPLLEAYSSGGCFTFENRRPVFTPKREIGVAFDIHLRYTTDYRMVSSKRLAGFDSLHLGNGCDVEVELLNPFKDKRDEVMPGVAYKLVIFDYNPALDYMLMGYGNVTSGECSVEFEEGYSGATELYVRTSELSTYGRYTGDWALYEGYVSTTGRREVEIDVRTPFELLTPNNPKTFNDIYFGGAEQGQTLTLCSRCSITPIFSGAAGYGQQVGFADIANHDITQAQLLDAIAQMFNLRFYTHRPSGQLIIEPYDDICRGDIHDLRERQIDAPMLCEESVIDSFATTKLSYQSPEGATARLIGDTEDYFGMWTHHVESYATKYSVDSRMNKLFLPTASFAGLVGQAPSAEVLTVGDRDTIAEDDYVKPRIALYYGLMELDNDEQWPSLSGTSSYPLVAFHSPRMGDTLCFEDRDGCRGLNRYYLNELKEIASRQRLSCSLRLTPREYATLFDPDSDKASLFSLFRLEFEGASSLFRLCAIEDYDPDTYTARCLFQRTLND